MTAPATVVRQAGIRIGRFDNRIGERVYRMRVVRIVQSSIVERHIANAWPTNGQRMAALRQYFRIARNPSSALSAFSSPYLSHT